MKKKKNLLFMFFLFCLSCQKEPLEGAKWKLVGIVDAETGYILELEPRDCEYCYTLTFYTDYTATTHRINRGSEKLDLHRNSRNRDPSIIFEKVLKTEKYEKDGEYYEVSTFEHLLFHIKSFTVTNDELKLFYSKGYHIADVFHDKKCFSLFKRIDK